MTTQNYGLVSGLDECEALVGELLDSALPFAHDIETGYDGDPKWKCQLHPEDPDSFVVGISLTNNVRWARYIPLRHDCGLNLDNAKVAELLWPLMQTGLGTAWNAKMELRWMSRWFTQYLGDHRRYGPQVRAAHLGDPKFCGYYPIRSDPMLEAHAEGKSQTLGLKAVTETTFHYKMMELPELFALAKGKPLTSAEEDCMRFNVLDLTGEHRDRIIAYACEDSSAELLHHLRRYPELSDPHHPQHLIYRLEMAILPIVCAMEDEGLLCDWQFMREGAIRAKLFREKLVQEVLGDLTEMLREKGIDEPCNINLGSSQQLGRVLYEQLGMPVHRRTPKKAPSVEAKTALKPLAAQFPVVQKIINAGALKKLGGTYLEVYERRFSYAPDGRTHPNVMQCGVPAGRLAVSDWPYQQSPKYYRYVLAGGEEFTYNFRYAVKAPPGWYILGFDYAQQERRALAGEAGEQALLEVFNTGTDIHKATAAMLFGIPIEEVTPEQRDVGKTIGFAMDYGLGEDGLADRLGISLEQAERLYARYFEVYSRLKPYSERIAAQARLDHYVITRFGRRVPIWGYDSPSFKVQSDADRQAANVSIQGPGTGDYPKIAMVKATEALRRAGLAEPVRMVMNMHDALYWHVRKDVPPLRVIQVLQPAVVFTMPQIAHWPKMVAEWNIGERWGAMSELAVTLDEAGVPVALAVKQGSSPVPAMELDGAEDDGPSFAVDKAVVAELAREPAVAAESPGAQAGSRGSSAGGGGSEPLVASGPPGSGVVVIAVSEIPPLDSLKRFVQRLATVPGQSEVVLRTPAGEDITLSSGCGLTCSRAPEVELQLGVSLEVYVEPRRRPAPV